MAKRTCTMPECGKPYRARGLCSTHYNQANAKPIEHDCSACGAKVAKSQRYARRVTCSSACRAYLQYGPQSCTVPSTHASRSCSVPVSHPSRVPVTCVVPESHPSRQEQRAARVRWYAGLCVECGNGYVINSEWLTHSRYCSATCQRRHARRARRAREHGATGAFTWDSFARLATSLGNACAYCEGDNDGLPLEPDHVVPLSRHGHNGLTNILPSCRRCNGDKRDLLVHEWAADRESRGLPHVRYDVGRFVHLTAHDHSYAA